MAERREIPPTRRGYDLDEAASALQKCIRRGLVDEAIYWAVELDESGFSAYLWYRLMDICSEDIGLAEPTMPAQINSLHEIYLKVAKRKNPRKVERLMIVQATMALAMAKKSRAVDHAFGVHYLGDEPKRPVPEVALDRHTKAGRQRGAGMRQFWEEGTLLADAESGELTYEGALPDPWRDRAMAATGFDPGQLPLEES
jgi:replication-associated recombination protein RarA